MSFQMSDLKLGGGARITGLLDGTADDQPASVRQLRAAQEGVSWKTSVRVAAQGNINLASPGAAVDGITMAPNDRFIAPAQTDMTQIGIYVWNGSTTPATRALDADTARELEQASVRVEEGTSKNVQYVCTSVNFTLGTDPVTFVVTGAATPPASTTQAGSIRIATQAEVDAGTAGDLAVSPLTLANAANRPRRAVTNVGDNTANQFDITHNFGTRDVSVTVYRNSTPWDDAGCDISRPDINTVRLNFASPPTANAWRAKIGNV